MKKRLNKIPKRIKSVIFGCLFISFAAHAEGTFEYELLDDGTAAITGYSGDENLVIPEEIDGYAVSAIKKGAFDYDSFVRVVIPDSVQKIEERAFYFADIKSELTIPENIEIEEDAFREAELPETVVIEPGTTIGKTAFAYSSGIENLIVSEDVSVGEKAFYYAEDLDSVIFSSGVVIEEDAFRDSEIRNFTAAENYDPSGETIIEETAFAYCDSLEKVILPSDTILGKKAFHYAEISDSLIFMGSVEIGDEAFRDADLPETVVIPANSSVEENAFAYSEGIVNLLIEKNVRLEDQVFYCAEDLSIVAIMPNVTVGRDAFRETSIKEVNISDNCILKSGAFAYISDLEKANISESVVMEEDTFSGSDPVISSEVIVDEAFFNSAPGADAMEDEEESSEFSDMAEDSPDGSIYTEQNSKGKRPGAVTKPSYSSDFPAM